MLTKEKITRIAELQIKIATIDERLEFLRDSMRQLLFENCKVQISFTMINLDIQAGNEAKKQSVTMGGLAGVAFVNAEAIAATFGLPVELLQPRKPSLVEDKTNFLADFTEGNAVQILNIFYQQERAHQVAYQMELQQLIMPEGLHQNKSVNS